MMSGVLADDGGPERSSTFLDAAAFTFLLAGTVILPMVFWPWSANVFVQPKFEVMRLLTAAGVLTAGGWLLLQPHRRGLSHADVAVLVFVLLNTVAYALSIDRQTSLFGEPLQRAGLVTVISLAGVYGTARLAVRSSARLHMVVLAASAAGTMVAVYAVLQLAGADPVWRTIPGDRVFSSIGQPNWLAAYLVMTIPLTVALFLTADSGVGRILGFGAATIQVVVLLATRSRSGYVALLAISVMGMLLAARRLHANRDAATRLLVLVAAAIVAGGTLLLGLGRTNPNITASEITQRAISVVDIGGFDAQRYVSLWEVGTSMTLDHPLTGSGQDTYATLFPDYRDRVLDPLYAEHFSRYRPESPHNVYLSVSTGAGIPAAVVYVLVIATALASVVTHSGSSTSTSILLAGIAAAIAGHLVTDWFMTLDLAGSWLFWALIGGSLGFSAGRAEPDVSIRSQP